MQDNEEILENNSDLSHLQSNEFEVEIDLISAMLFNSSLISYAATRLSKTDFQNPILRILYSNIVELYKENQKSITLNILKERLNSDLFSVDSDEYELILERLTYSVNQLNIDEFKKYIDIKKCQSIQFELISFSNSLSKINLTTKNIKNELDRLNSNFFSITSSWVVNADGKTLKSLIEQTQDEIKNKKNNLIEQNEFSASKYNWCLKSVEELLDGFNKKQLYILAARPGMGKSTLALNWAVAYAERAYTKNKKLGVNDKKHCVLFFTLEMRADQLTNKIISMVSYIENWKVQKRVFTSKDNTDFLMALKNFNLQDLPLTFMDDGDYNLSEIESIVREESSKYQVDLVIIDYLQLIKLGDDRIKFNMNRTNEVAVISKTLKTMALTLDIPIIALSQLSRRVEGNNGNEIKKPMLSDLRESGSIEQDADVVMFLYVDQKAQTMISGTNGKETYGITFAIEKNRFGSKGIRELEFAKFCSRFDDNGELPNTALE